MLVSNSNAEDVNKKRLRLFSLVAKRTLTTLVGQCDDDILVNLKNTHELDRLIKKLDTVIVYKLRDKFKI